MRIGSQTKTNYQQRSSRWTLATSKLLMIFLHVRDVFKIGHFRSTCKNNMEYCRTRDVGVNDIKQHKETCDKQQCCIGCKWAHDSNNIRCPEIESYRAMLTKSILSSPNAIAHQPNSQRNARDNFHHKDCDFPVLNSHINNGNYRGSISTVQLDNTSKNNR